MAYIGKQPTVGNFVKLDAITTSATTTFNLTNGGVAYSPQSPNHCIVSLNGVIQSPTSAYTISGSTIVFSDALTSSDTIDFILVLGDVLNIGTPSDGTITSAKLASGVSGLISWQSVQTTGFTAVSGRGYPCNTTSSAFTVTLPASPVAGDTIILVDYARTWGTNNLTINPNSNKFQGGTANAVYNTNGLSLTLVYIDSTKGWIPTVDDDSTNTQSYSVDFLVVAGGGGGGGGKDDSYGGGGGGAGGYRNSYSTETSGGGGSTETDLTLTRGAVYTVTVGAGGAGGTNAVGVTGSNSSISGTGITTITSSGGGYGGGGTSTGGNGGSGGAGIGTSNGTGTANQGYNGGQGLAGANAGGGGGGAGAVGSNASGSNTAGNGGTGLASSITGSSVTRAGGGGGGAGSAGTGGSGGSGGGGNGANASGTATAGTTNTGSGGGAEGGGANGSGDHGVGRAGGSGVVILRMATANYSGTTTGSPTVSTSGSDTILTFNASGSYTA